MAASCANIDVIIDDSNDNTPSCPHGPTLLFERQLKNDGRRKFFACSAFRDRKQCDFFRWADDFKAKASADRAHLGSASKSSVSGMQQLTHGHHRKRFLKFKKQPLSKRSICCTCGLLLLAGEVTQHEEQGHQIKHRITRAALRRPTTLFSPQDDNKTFAQYLFSNSAVDFTIESLSNLEGVTHVLCVGAPRIHEAITLRRKQPGMTLTSLLLDLDSRYAQVYPRSKMCRYNMFNHHFFDLRSEARLRSFLRDGGAGLVLVTDPPFGGMVQPLAATFSKIEKSWKEETGLDQALRILWFFPYFMEKRIIEFMPSLIMLDYKVDYDNHTLFTSKDGARKKGSPVRIFTNLSPACLLLPASQGYWFCDKCQRYSAPENKHCLKCQSCTSKDGTTYVHCDLCQRCVKSTRVHCEVCGTCSLPSHTCGQQHGTGCYICGDMGHKRRDCPQRHSNTGRKPGQKRHATEQPGKVKKKYKTT